MMIFDRLTGKVPKAGQFKKPVVYRQQDIRWGKCLYTSCGNNRQTMENSGSVPTLAADIVATLKDSTVTPWELAKFAIDKGFRSKLGCTSFEFFKHIAIQYEFSKFMQTCKLENLKACIDDGGYAICYMGIGQWTRGRAYVLAWAYDDEYIYCITGNGSSDKQKQPFFRHDARIFFCFWP